MRHLFSAITFALLTVAVASAQSLNVNSPAPLKAGVNVSQTDNFTGTHYWYFYAGPGKVTVHCAFKGGGLMGNSMNSTLTFTLSDPGRTWQTSKVLVSGSTADTRETTFTANLKKRQEVILSVAPVANGLVRMGGQYEISISGAVSYGQDKSGDPIVQTFMQFSGMTKNYGLTKFNANGTVVASDGSTGTWKLFDAASHTYVVVLDGQHLSLIYMPGRGLVSAGDPNNVVFKALK
jgi:WD40 repeat protein